MRNVIFLLALLCTACSTSTASLPTIRPYHMDIQQGNVVTNKMMLQLKPDMTKAQVRFIMGTPLIADSFHSDRWDYFYSMQKGGRIIEQRRVILEFENDKLKHVRGDVIPAGSAGTSGDQGKKPAAEPKSIWENKPAAPKEEKKGVLDKLKFWGNDKKSEPGPEQKPELKEEAKPAQVPVELINPAAETISQPAPAVEAGKEEKKGLLDKLKFWGDDKKPEQKPEPEAKPDPAPVPKPAPVSKPEPVVKEQLAATPIDESRNGEKKGLLDKLKFWGDDKKAASEPEIKKPSEKPVAKPAPAPAKVKEAQPQTALAKPAPKVETVEPKPVPKPADLPPEDAPTYFERMLEKIGF